MEYLLIMTETQADFDQREDPTTSAAYWGAWGAYVQALQEAGVLVSGAGLQAPHTATTLRVREGQRQVHDGPYAETREMLAGFFRVELPHLDAALDWAARSPAAANAAVEVRPVLPPTPPAAS